MCISVLKTIALYTNISLSKLNSNSLFVKKHINKNKNQEMFT